jgi:uncharacterized membrane protein YgaE (UPF0421/DUF939 family)
MPSVAGLRRVVRRPTPRTLSVVRRRTQPAAVTIARLTLTAAVAYLVAVLLLGYDRPVLAALSAMLVAQVSLYQTFRNAIQRVAAVVAGVLLALGLSLAVGFTWWSVSLVIAAALAVGYLLRLGDNALEVPISAMLILSLDTQAAAVARVVETLIGAAVGMLAGLVLAPLRIQPAEEAIDELAGRLSGLLHDMATGLTDGSGLERTGEWLQRSRALGGELERVDSALGEAEESIRLNPRQLLVTDPRTALRDRLEMLEHAVITTRGIARSLVDSRNLVEEIGLDRAREIAQPLAAVLEELSRAAAAYGRTAFPATDRRQRQQADVEAHLERARRHQEELVEILRGDAARRPQTWPLGGELVIHLQRLQDQLRPPGASPGPRPRRPLHRLLERAKGGRRPRGPT